jgi:O-antigen ligase
MIFNDNFFSMQLQSPKCRFFDRLYCGLTVLLFISAVVGRAFSSLNSIVIILLLVTSLVEGRFKQKINRLLREPLIYISAAYLILCGCSILLSENAARATFILQRELPVFIIPVVLLSKAPFSKESVVRIFKYFVLTAFVWMSVASIRALFTFFKTGSTAVFFYHNLAAKTGSTAIYSSMFCVLSLLLIPSLQVTKKIKILLFLCFTLWLILLASRMFLLIYACLLLIHIFYNTKIKHRGRVALTTLGLLLLLCFACPTISRRFTDLEKFKTTYLTSTQFNSNIYFDGLSLRAIYVRFSLEIMHDSNSYLLGVGTGDADALLKGKIRAYHMNTTDNPKDGNGGYLRYSFHNVYLEHFVALGIIGLAVIVLLYGYVGYMGIKHRKPILLSVCMVMTLSSLTDTIVINSQSDVSMLMAIICLSIMGIREAKICRSVQNLQSAN